MASRRQAKKKGKAAKNAEHGNVQASAAASRKKTPQEEIQQADGVQPFLETPEHTEATAKGKSTQVPAPENNALTGGDFEHVQRALRKQKAAAMRRRITLVGPLRRKRKKKRRGKQLQSRMLRKLKRERTYRPGRLPKAKRMPRRRNRSPSLRRMRRTPERRTQMPVESWSCRTSRKGFRSFPPHRRPHIMRSRPPSRKLCRIKRHANRRDGITHCFIFRS